MLEGKQEVIVYKCEVCGRESLGFSAIKKCEKQHANEEKRKKMQA